MKISYLAIGLLLYSAQTHSLDLPRTEAVPGGITTVALLTDSEPQPIANFLDNRVMVIPAGGYWQAVVGLPLTLAPGTHSLITIDGNNMRQTYNFEVQAKEYAAQYLTLKNKRQVNPTAEDLKRIKRESRLTKAAFKTWTDKRNPSLVFDTPVNGRISSTFGLRRFFNNQPRRPHSGLDIAAPLGTPIAAPEAGTIITTGEYFFNGKTVFIDHGMGLVSMFNHLSQIDVTPGMQVRRGQTIGKIGMSGRVTGPHLHWSVSLNNSRVDPALLLPEEMTVKSPGKADKTIKESDRGAVANRKTNVTGKGGED